MRVRFRVTMVMAIRPCEGRKTAIMFEYLSTAQRTMHSCSSSASGWATVRGRGRGRGRSRGRGRVRVRVGGEG